MTVPGDSPSNRSSQSVSVARSAALISIKPLPCDIGEMGVLLSVASGLAVLASKHLTSLFDSSGLASSNSVTSPATTAEACEAWQLPYRHHDRL